MQLISIMQYVTAALFAALGVYGYMMYSGSVPSNFSALLMTITAVTGLYWLAERFYFLPQRKLAAQRFEDELTAKQAHLAQQGINQTDTVDVKGTQSTLLAQPWWLDWTAGLFPVIAAVFVFRSFAWEPFKIPSGSMIPTLYIGDLILVNKHTYGFKVPVFNQRITQGNAIERSDVIVFRYPPQPTLDYIKRVVGLPGDEVSYLNKELKINGKPVAKKAMDNFFDPDTLSYSSQFEEELQAGRPMRLLNSNVPARVDPLFDELPFKTNCTWSVEGVVCKVPAGHYFVMGDNRDNSQDSRFWGFVPEANVVGRATRIWMNFSHLSRVGNEIK
jgi:signal peptidase I